jgi:hypothetical protein
MRAKERISIILDLLDNNYMDFLIDIGIGEENRHELIDVYFLKGKEIEEFWMENPDLRLTQVLVNLDIIPNIAGFWYYTEETDYVVEKGWCEFEDIHFWGVNFTKDGERLPETIFKRVSDLDRDHVMNILKFYDEKSSRTKINSKYLKYFEKIEKEELEKEIKNIIKDDE